ncbi:MAG: 1-acyl-sn-glycerol-3-phosphate acyltransferase [Leptospiraceae bacterium]|nr:1-acyl-sn-glycerol-3-phosphate acyltransferase [Leptospiraceae bacterium]MCP5493496.1 1-acyl-sn-glycerol-3-phosphate acyltransferase [Leptospiraceae bacterium]
MNQNNSTHPGKTAWASNILYFMGNFLYKLRFNISYEIQENLQIEGPVLILSKHSSNHDIPIGYPLIVKVLKRHAWCIIKDELTKPVFFGFFLKIGGIPIDRKNPEKSKKSLALAKKTLYDGNAMVLFPEQSRHYGKMGKGKLPGFRFIVGKPSTPLAVVCAGYDYKKGFLRKQVIIRFGKAQYFSKQDSPDEFLHNCMIQIAELSGLKYPF